MHIDDRFDDFKRLRNNLYYPSISISQGLFNFSYIYIIYIYIYIKVENNADVRISLIKLEWHKSTRP